MGAGSQGSPLGGVGTAASFLIQGASPGSQWSPGASPPDAALDGGWQDTQDCCQGDCAPRVSMATAPLNCSPSLPGCSCPGNPRALLAPAALGHPGFGGGGQCWQATVSQAAVLGLEGDDVPPPQGSGHHCCWAGGLLGAKVPLQGCPQDSQPDMRPQRTQ